MPIPFRFRPATQADWPAVSQLLASSQLPLDGAYEHLDTFELAFKNDVLVGVAGLEIYGKAPLLARMGVRVPEAGAGRVLEEALVHVTRPEVALPEVALARSDTRDLARTEARLRALGYVD